MNGFQLPNDLLLGSATAATQIEGGDVNSNWYPWSIKGKIAGGASTITGSDHYARFEDDVALLKEMNQKIYRFSIEWSRIEPKMGQWSEEGIRHYRQELSLLKAAGIEPLVTLHHFSHPQWFEEIGQWTDRRSVYYFKRFVKKVVTELGSDIRDYCTINEPNVFCNDTFIDGKYPPGSKNNVPAYFKASRNMILAHKDCYSLIHNIRSAMGYKDTNVGFAIHIARFECQQPTSLNKMAKSTLDYVFHGMYMDGMIHGTLPRIRTGIRKFFRNDHTHISALYADFIGINYYSRHLIRSGTNIGTLFTEVSTASNLPDNKLNDLGWEIYPEGIYHVCREAYEQYGLPIYITENGIPDSEDSKRQAFIYDHLEQLKRLRDDGVDIQRYYHWSFLDNLEWNDGYEPRFGLVEVNYDTFDRTLRASGKWYSDICRTGYVSKL